MTPDNRYSVSIDIGGTFTDCVVRDGAGRFVIDKAFTTPGDLVRGLLDALANAASQWGLGADDLLSHADVFKVGTTSCVNRLINRAGSKTALLTTRGHEDALFIGRVRQKTDGLSEAERMDLRAWRKADPIVPRWLVYGLNERVDSFGEVLCALDEGEVRQAVEDCVAQGVESIAVCFLWSFANPDHEHRVRQVVERVAPDAFVVVSSEIAPVLGEYERASTTVLNAYLGPGTAKDLASLEGALRASGLRSDVFVMQSNGGVLEASEAVDRPVYLLGSGPVGGVAAVRNVSARVDAGNAIGTDMGGTSFDVGVVVSGQPIEEREPVHNRYRVSVAALEVTSIGAGGGSIASVDPVTGVLQVGPNSAGSNPGPVCYGFGGEEPTVTDANAVLGRLNPERFFSGRRTLDVAGARHALATRIAEPLETTVEEAAAAVIDIVDNRMADLIRNLTIQRGLDPREFAIVAYGGGGPLHVGQYAHEIGVRTVVIPRAAPVYSAWGIADSPVLQTYAMSVPTLLPCPPSVLQHTFATLLERARERGDGETGVAGEDAPQLYVDMHYRFQRSQLPVAVALEELEKETLSETLMERFESLYEERYGAGTTFRAAGIEISTFRVQRSRSFAHEPSPVWTGPAAVGEPGERKVWFKDALVSVPIYEADGIHADAEIPGPCIIESQLMTVVVHPGQMITVDASGDFVLTTGA